MNTEYYQNRLACVCITCLVIFYQSWSPRGHGLGLEAPRGQPIVSLALASGKMFPVLVLGFEPKSVNILVIF